ncbi:MAG TPA: helix-turn-helix domain-containing protein [Candidatus Tectomicrobia bacterium]|nr:helix-turn-helix domain-containing protein [Candidatus Tectomicrobia bacterium]
MIRQHVDADVSAAHLLGLEEAATYLGITPRSIYRLVAQGLLTPVRLPSVRRTLFDRRNLEDLGELARAASASNHHESAGYDGVEESEGEVQR